MMQMVQRALSQWAKEQKANLSKEIQTLIEQANYDLYYGPGQNEDYPGFTTATNKIRNALEEKDILNDVWVDCDCECVLTSDPSDDPECNLEYIRVVDVREVVAAIVGNSLAPYIL